MKKSQGFSLLAFVVGVAGFQMYAHRLEREARGGTPEEVLIVTQDLEPGAVLSEENLGKMLLPSDYLDGRRILGKDRGNLLGVTLGQRLRAGEGLVWSDITDGTRVTQLSEVVLPGMRAYSLPADANPLGLLLRSGDQVDVLLESAGQAETLLERILVLAVGSQWGKAAASEPALGRGAGVTLSVTPDQAAELLRADTRGRLQLVLRNGEDHRPLPSEEEQGALAKASPTASSPSVDERKVEHVR